MSPHILIFTARDAVAEFHHATCALDAPRALASTQNGKVFGRSVASYAKTIAQSVKPDQHQISFIKGSIVPRKAP